MDVTDPLLCKDNPPLRLFHRAVWGWVAHFPGVAPHLLFPENICGEPSVSINLEVIQWLHWRG